MTLLIKSGGAAALPEWQAAFSEYAPELTVLGWGDDSVDPNDVEYALVWEPERGRLASYPNLKLIISAAAGVDHILADPDLPPHVPIARMVMTETAERMSDFVLFSAFGLIRHLPELIQAQTSRAWSPRLNGRLASETTVGVMGLGLLGARSALRLQKAGFNVVGWSRSPKDLLGVSCFSGQKHFSAFLARAQVLVNLLPDTDETRGIINESVLNALPFGAMLINVGRGRHIEETALFNALDSGRLAGAILDVFDEEPLGQDSPFWAHPKIFVTPHIASTISRPLRAKHAVEIIKANRLGAHIPNLFDRDRGY